MDKSNKYSFYGLPEKVEHCKKCLMTNQKPFSVNEMLHSTEINKKGLIIDKNGLCSACNYESKKIKEIDWEAREKLLNDKLNKYRSSDGSYDCIVPGSGGKDSAMASHILKYKYGMHPLTVTYAPLLYTNEGIKNMQNWISIGGFDNILFTPNGKISRILAKEAFTNILHPIQPFKFGLKIFPIKMALKHNIKLVFYGEPRSEYGSEEATKVDSPKFGDEFISVKKNNEDLFIAGLTVKELKNKYGFNDNDLEPYSALDYDIIQGKNIEVDNLGWYLKWDPQEAYYYAVENCGFEPDSRRTDGTYGKYSGIDDKFDSLHFFCHFIKFGIGRTRLDASQEIRNGHITREEAIMLIKKFEGEFPSRFFKDCLDFMDINEEYFWQKINQARSPHLWKKIADKWILQQEVRELQK
jgi:N-acetyl sugar amidotransferase